MEFKIVNYNCDVCSKEKLCFKIHLRPEQNLPIFICMDCLITKLDSEIAIFKDSVRKRYMGEMNCLDNSLSQMKTTRLIFQDKLKIISEDI